MHPSGTFAVIPARYGSTRFPGKPLVEIDGVPMVVRVADRVRQAKRVDQVIVATDDERITRVVQAAGHRAVMTPPDCASGTDRVAFAARELAEPEPAVIINVQGDEPLIDPRDVDVLADLMLESRAPMGTLARPIPSPEAFASTTVVKVVTALDGRALYFSRAPMSAAEMHVGIYAYTPVVLERLAALPRTPLEIAENLEQLRALENGIEIHVARCVSLSPTQAVDVPEDIDRVVRILKGSAHVS